MTRKSPNPVATAFLALIVMIITPLFLATLKLSERAARDDEREKYHSVPTLSTIKSRYISLPTIMEGTTSNTPTQRSFLDYRLEFLHIPKTGGTLIEVIAKEHGVSWGACKFNPKWRQRKKSKSLLKDCPNMTKPQLYTTDAMWHYPIQDLYREFPDFELPENDPYNNLPPVQQQSLPIKKKFFAVIRNPYSWFISLYTMCPPCSRKEDLSTYVIKYFKNKKLHSHCQYEFLYNTSSSWDMTTKQYSQRIVDKHLVVRFESLKDDLEALWTAHGFTDWKVPQREERAINQHKSHKKLSVKDFSKAALELIHERCRLDFVEGAYEMVNLTI